MHFAHCQEPVEQERRYDSTIHSLCSQKVAFRTKAARNPSQLLEIFKAVRAPYPASRYMLYGFKAEEPDKILSHLVERSHSRPVLCTCTNCWATHDQGDVKEINVTLGLDENEPRAHE